MNIRHIRRAVGLVAKSSVSELHFEDAMGMTLIVRNQPRPELDILAGVTDAGWAASICTQAPQAETSPAAHIVASPMVGRFFRGAGRDGAPLVSIGETVEAGQSVGSIEMMRLMHAIRSAMVSNGTI